VIPVLALSLVLSWVQVKSDTFVVKSSVGLDRAKRVLRELESFRELIGATLVFRKVELPDLPVEVLLVGDEVMYAELSPEFNGKRVAVAGYYERGQDRDFIVLRGNSGGNQTHVVYHELTHYFASRSLEVRPTWLSEGLAEYFATAEIGDEAAYLGAAPPERLASLKSGRRLTVKELLAVDDRSAYYNETVKANMFYAEAWAFVHFLTNGPYSDEFKRYLEALTHGDVPFSSFVTTKLDQLDQEFETYLQTRIRYAPRERVKTHPDAWQMQVNPVSAADVELVVTEILLSAGRFDQAREHLERVANIDDEFSRASFYKGVLARISHQGDPREYFIDALMDVKLGPRAAINLVQLHELSIPAARRALEQASTAGTHMGDVYWALSEIYLNDTRRAKELVVLTSNRDVQIAPRVKQKQANDTAERFVSYSRGEGDHFRYELLSGSEDGPRVQSIVAPLFPEELLQRRLSGRVVVDAQVTEDGNVGGIWLISALPEVFSGLAAEAVRSWKFDPIFRKIRIVIHFVP